IGRAVFKDTVAAFWTGPQRFAATEVRRLRIVGAGAGRVAEIELQGKLVRQLNDGAERATDLAAKSVEGTDLTLGKQRLRFRHLKLTARDNFPKAELALLALEFFIVFSYFAAAFRAARLKRCEVAGHGIAFVILRLRDDMPRHFLNLRHERFAIELA